MTEYAAYLQSPEWSARRHQALDDADHCCQVCNSSRDLEVHHRTYKHLGHEPRADLTVLCNECHTLFHSRMSRRFKRAHNTPDLTPERTADIDYFRKLAASRARESR